jgi:hypothetical protein
MKRHRTTQPPPGYDLPARNPRLYGTLAEQISGAALASRGTPNPDRAIVKARPRKVLALERETAAHRAHLQRAQDRMLSAQREVRRLKSCGQPYSDAATEARAARAEYLKLTGGVERREVQVAETSESGLGVRAA